MKYKIILGIVLLLIMGIGFSTAQVGPSPTKYFDAIYYPDSGQLIMKFKESELVDGCKFINSDHMGKRGIESQSEAETIANKFKDECIDGTKSVSITRNTNTPPTTIILDSSQGVS